MLFNIHARAVQQIAEHLSPEKGNLSYNFELLDLGALVYIYGLPKCEICPINEYCDYNLAGNPHRI